MNLYEVAEDAYMARAGTVSTNGIGAAVDAVEPLIRADERATFQAVIDGFDRVVVAAEKYESTLRSAVAALPDAGPTVHPYSQGYRMAVRDVLALIDGGNPT